MTRLSSIIGFVNLDNVIPCFSRCWEALGRAGGAKNRFFSLARALLEPTVIGTVIALLDTVFSLV
jgi:hypothetical protein